MPFLSPRHETDLLESYAVFERVTHALEGGNMFVQRAAEIPVDGPRIDDLRYAIKANRVSFPVPVPIFPTQFKPDIQWRLVELYFIRGWSSRQLAERYGITARRVQQSLQHWASRAMARGYLQAIPPETTLAMPMRPWPAVSVPAAIAVVRDTPHYSPIPASVAPDLAAMPPA